jgi:hypothetical protein
MKVRRIGKKATMRLHGVVLSENIAHFRLAFNANRRGHLKFFGGTKPLHVSTLYRGVHSKLYPPPMNVNPQRGPLDRP